jgi:hypothetical protein
MSQQRWKEVKKKETDVGNPLAQVQREFARMLGWRCDHWMQYANQG